MENEEKAWLDDLNARIAPLDAAACARARDKWNAVAKPIGALGVLEDAIVQLAGLFGTQDFALDKRMAVIMCADNGVVAQGVSQCGSEVTTVVAESIARGTSSICSMARPQGVESMAVDVGMETPANDERVLDRSIARGTADISLGPAMTRDQARRAVQAGIDIVADLKAAGYNLIVSGEMSIGNTTTSSTLACALLGMDVDGAVGRGAGLSDAGLVRKVDAVKRALAVNDVANLDALGTLAAVGGFDIAGLVGLFIGGALYRTPVVVDGFISMIAAYIATLLCPQSTVCMLASHASAEPAVHTVNERLAERCLEHAHVRFRPIILADMRLGEGTGAVCLVPLLDSALALYDGSTFEASGIEADEVNPQ